ncbi:MAG: glycosyltransferase [Aggregatilineales bacterium]
MSSRADKLTDFEALGIQPESAQTLNQPLTHSHTERDPATSRTQSILGLVEQVEFYKTRLALEAKTYDAEFEAEEAAAYVLEARKVHAISGRKIATFAPFDFSRSALRTITKAQISILAALSFVLALAIIRYPLPMLTAAIASVTLFYFGNLLITLWLSTRPRERIGDGSIPDDVVYALSEADWPPYTILCPLYKETEVVRQFAKAMQALDYPTEKLQVLFLTEDDDEATRTAIREAQLPAHFQIVTVPEGQPRTKPRACNYGLLKARGRYVVIFDAEDIPDPLQLKKAVLTFAKYGPDLGCVQAKLNFYNTNQNLLTRWFTIEYSTWFDGTLPGLQCAKLPLPLGGTSNHFRLETLRKVGAWDAFNVTEDCDLGLRLSEYGLETVVLDSITREEANAAVGNWIRQRSRWIKGYMQTYLIHMRQPTEYLRQGHFKDFISLNLIIGGRTVILLINPIMWLLLLGYLLLGHQLEATYRVMFPPLVLYVAVLCLVLGNVTYIYTHFVGCLKRGQYSLIKWTLLIPIYWVMTSYAAYKALFQLITKPHYWEKTKHGLHLSYTEITGSSLPRVRSAESTKPTAESVPQAEPIDLTNGVSHAAPMTRSTAFGGESGTRQLRKLNPIIGGPPHISAHTARRFAWPAFRLTLPRDRWLIASVVIACFASIVSIVYFALNNDLLSIGDAPAHLEIARRVVDNLTPGFAQLGGIWLPLPHLAMLPFIQLDWLWRTGLAGACVAAPCYLISVIYSFLAARRLTKDSRASFIGSLVFILNPNILYLQSTPLSELVFLATMTVSCYYFLAWVQDDDPHQLIALAVATFLTTLARYDGWPLFLCFAVLIGLISWIKHRNLDRCLSNLSLFGLLGGLGIALWIAWCAAIFGDPLYFQRSQFSAQAQQQALISQNLLFTYRDLGASIRTFSIDAAVALGPGLFVLGALGLVILLWRRRLSGDTLATLMYLVPSAFYVVSLYTGQGVLWSPQSLPAGSNDWPYYNTRYGVVAIVPAVILIAILVNYLSQKIRLPTSLRFSQPAFWRVGQYACVIAILGQTVLTVNTGVIVLQDAHYGASCMEHRLETYLYQHYNGGRILVSVYANDDVADFLGPLDGIAFQNLIYDGSGSFWHQALSDPASVADWVIVKPGSSIDQVAARIDVTSPSFLAQYTLMMQDTEGHDLFYRNGQPLAQRQGVPPNMFRQSCNR